MNNIMPYINDDERELNAAGPSTPSKKRVSCREFETPTNRHLSEPQTGSSCTQSADDIEAKIFIDGRGQIRIDVPCDEFYKSFSSRLEQDIEPRESHIGYFHITDSQSWDEGIFHEDVLKSSMEDMCANSDSGLQFRYHSKKYPDGSQDARPDFLIAKISEARATRVPWKDVELVMGHSSEPKKQPKKFSQWLRDARTVFERQPHRRFCFGVIFLKPHAFLCYADHGCAAFSEPLELTQQSDGRKFLVQFLTSFLKSDDWQRGRDPDLIEEDDTTTLRQGDQRYKVGTYIFRSTALIGRNVQVFNVKEQEGSKRAGVCKSVWEEIPSTLQSGEATHRSECDVIKHLQNASVRGLPEVWGLEYAQVKGPYAKTASVPQNGRPFNEGMLPKTLEKRASKFVTSGQASADRINKSQGGKRKSSGFSKARREQSRLQEAMEQSQSQEDNFFTPTNHQRQLYRIVMSKCQGLHDKIRQDGFEELMPVVRDAMICYYECYKIPNPGQLQGDISDMNIMATRPNTALTEISSEMQRRKGTIIDWNYSYPASGSSTSRHVRSGTPAFMALELLDSENNVQRRTLRHDLESFFTVMLLMAISHENPKWKSSRFAKAFSIDRSWDYIFCLKTTMFQTGKGFKKHCLDEIKSEIPGEQSFKQLLEDMRNSLYSDHSESSSDDKDITEKCEALFMRIMGIIDSYLGNDHGTTSLKEIDDRKAARTISGAEVA